MLIAEPLRMPSKLRGAQRHSSPRKLPERVLPPAQRKRLNYIYEWRKAAGMTQAQLAEAVGVTAATMSNYENGKVNLQYDTLEAVARAIASWPDSPVPWTDNCDRIDLLTRLPGEDDPRAYIAKMSPEDQERTYRFMRDFAGLPEPDRRKAN